MKVKINYVVEIDDDHRRAINFHYGYSGLASRKQIKKWFRMFGEGSNVLEDEVNEWRRFIREYATLQTNPSSPIVLLGKIEDPYDLKHIRILISEYK